MPTVRPCPSVQASDEGQHVDLVADVEVGRRLVEEEDPRPLRESHRHPGSLALAARERVDRPIRKRLQPGRDQSPLDGVAILRRMDAPAATGGGIVSGAS